LRRPFSISEDEIAREPTENRPIVTIDGENARTLMTPCLCKEDGHYELSSIADVALRPPEPQ
jgi:hypothetical protein